VNIVVASNTLAFMDAYVAQGAGTFNSAGLAPNWVGVVPNAAQALATVTSGSADVVNLACSAPIAAVAANRPVVIFAGGSIGVTSFVVISKAKADALAKQGITPTSPIADRLKALKGMTIGTGSAGGPTELNVRIALESVGINPDKDVKFQSGTPDAEFAAFKSGQLDANVQGVPNALQVTLDKTGVVWISGPNGDVPQWNKGYFLCWVTSQAFAQAHADVLKRLIAGLQTTSDLIKNDRTASLAALKKSFTTLDPNLLAASFDAQRKSYITDPNVKKSVMQDTIDLYNASAPTKVSLTPEDLVPTGFLS
jgi:NitT/TauT family transport system substrate-binding protein